MRSGLFLDLDGTLADNLGIMRQVYDLFLQSHGHAGSDAEFESFNGPPLARIIEMMQQRYALPGGHAVLYQSYQDLIDSLYFQAPPMPGAADMLARAKSSGWIVYIVSSNSRARILRWLETAGISGYIDGIVSSEDITNGKPSPEPYLKALQLSGCAVDSSIAVEDSAQGVQAALAAGLRTHAYINQLNAHLAWSGNVTRLTNYRALAL